MSHWSLQVCLQPQNVCASTAFVAAAEMPHDGEHGVIRSAGGWGMFLLDFWCWNQQSGDFFGGNMQDIAGDVSWKKMFLGGQFVIGDCRKIWKPQPGNRDWTNKAECGIVQRNIIFFLLNKPNKLSVFHELDICWWGLNENSFFHLQRFTISKLLCRWYFRPNLFSVSEAASRLTYKSRRSRVNYDLLSSKWT